MRRDPTVIVDLLPWVLLMVVAIVVVVAAIYLLRFLRHWQFPETLDEQTLLAEFRELHRRGKLTNEEYREVRISLAEQMEQRADEAAANKETH